MSTYKAGTHICMIIRFRWVVIAIMAHLDDMRIVRIEVKRGHQFDQPAHLRHIYLHQDRELHHLFTRVFTFHNKQLSLLKNKGILFKFHLLYWHEMSVIEPVENGWRRSDHFFGDLVHHYISEILH